MQELTKIDGINYLAVNIPDNFYTGSISNTGKSLTYRVKGTYTDSKGYHRGVEGVISPFLRITFAEPIRPVKFMFQKSDLKHYAFGDDMIRTSILIRLN